MNEALKRIRDAVVGQAREVEVDPHGVVREVGEEAAPDPDKEKHSNAAKPTKLAPRTFGA